MKRQELEKAYNQAMQQYRNHQLEVSGMWSINGHEFCEKYNLDYDAAIEAEDDAFYSGLEEEYRDLLAGITRKIGELTEQQENNLYEYVAENNYQIHESCAFWDAILQEIDYKIKQLEKEG